MEAPSWPDGRWLAAAGWRRLTADGAGGGVEQGLDVLAVEHVPVGDDQLPHEQRVEGAVGDVGGVGGGVGGLRVCAEGVGGWVGRGRQGASQAGTDSSR